MELWDNDRIDRVVEAAFARIDGEQTRADIVAAMRRMHDDYELTLTLLRRDGRAGGRDMYDGVVIAQVLNVRSGPGVARPIIDRLRRGDRVVVRASSSAGGAVWYEIGYEQWVHGAWVRTAFDALPSPIETETLDAANLDTANLVV